MRGRKNINTKKVKPMKKTLLFLIILLYAVADSNAQYYTNRNKVWTFGQKAGIDFTSGSPVPIRSGMNYLGSFTEGVASVCDTAGHLLFYTNGKQVYNRNHVLMPSGVSIVPFHTYSTSQAAVIVPMIDSANRYYIFSLEMGAASARAGRLVYSKVDMTLDSSRGDVDTSVMGIPLTDSIGERMIAIAGTNHNIWLLTHSSDSTLFFAYEITSAGIDTVPVISAVGTVSMRYRYTVGVMKVSPNRRKIVSQCHTYSAGTELFDFDPATGIVSNCVVLDSPSVQYGAEFSPDNTKLYTQQYRGGMGNDTMIIHQYNIALATPAAIRASKTQVGVVNTHGVSDLKLGPDHKIYLAGSDDTANSLGWQFSRYMDRINSPNLAGTACGYTSQVLRFLDTTGIYHGLPNVYIEADTAITVGNHDQVPTSRKLSISIFPNPASTVLYVSATEKIMQISISNIAGQVVYSSAGNSKLARVDIGMLPPNLYFVKVNEVAVQRFVKE
jgi:hypothetical protein